MESQTSQCGSFGKPTQQLLYEVYEKIGEADLLTGIAHSNITDSNVKLKTQKLQGNHSKALRMLTFFV